MWHIVERFPEKYRNSMTIELSKRPKENKQSLLCQKDCSNAVHIFCSNTENNEYHPTSAWGKYTWHHFHSHKGHTLDHSLGCQEMNRRNIKDHLCYREKWGLEIWGCLEFDHASRMALSLWVFINPNHQKSPTSSTSFAISESFLNFILIISIKP